MPKIYCFRSSVIHNNKVINDNKLYYNVFMTIPDFNVVFVQQNFKESCEIFLNILYIDIGVNG